MYEIYCINKNNINKETTNKNEMIVMTFQEMSKAIEFIKNCTLYEMIYKIYFIKNKEKKLDLVYEYSENKTDKIKSWQIIN